MQRTPWRLPSPIPLSHPQRLQRQRLVVVEDGPRLPHGKQQCSWDASDPSTEDTGAVSDLYHGVLATKGVGQVCVGGLVVFPALAVQQIPETVWLARDQ
jgi:hypothetical protein